MRPLFFRLGLAAAIGATAFAVYAMRPEPLPDTLTLTVADIARPSASPDGIVFLFSGLDGYTQHDAQTARAVASNGSLVVGIDLKKSFAKVGSEKGCVYFVSDVEKISQLVQRSAGARTYLTPIVAGAGAGGAMVMALAAQSPLATIAHAVAIDPVAELPLKRELCSGAPHRPAADDNGWVYDLQAGQLPEPLTVVETPAADAAAKAHTSDLVAKGFAIDRVTSADVEAKAMTTALGHALAQSASPDDEELGDLPLAVLPAAASHDTMAIVLSGDGGWRDIDRQLGETLSQAGVPTVGIDSLRYFWTRKPPKTIAADLSRIVDHFAKAWNVHHVALIGYSFGADALPAAYDLLPGREKQRVTLVSLLALSRWAEFEFDVSGWLGMDGDTSRSTLPDVAKIPAAILQCVYGADDDDSVCGELAGSGAEVIKTDGGHHFDEDYDALAGRIIARLR
jgi:type IV secretory pathway VirJ component